MCTSPAPAVDVQVRMAGGDADVAALAALCRHWTQSPRSVPFYQRHGFGPADMLLARRLSPGP